MTRFVESLREKDAFPVQTMFERTFAGEANALGFELSDEEKNIPEMQKLLGEWAQLSGLENLDAEIEIEAEKEIAKEAEKEVTLDRPPAFEPHAPEVSTQLEEAIASGNLNSSFFIPAFRIFRDISAEKHMEEPEAWYDCLFVTRDFAKTVKDESNRKDASLRPVDFLLSFEFNDDLLLIISQHEANAIIPLVKKSKHAILHVYSPRVSRASETFDELDFFRITASERLYTPSPKLQSMLAIFARSL